MINVLPVLTKKEAATKFEVLNAESIQDFKTHHSYEDLRKEFNAIEEEVNQELGVSEEEAAFSTYDFDLLFGLKLYNLLKEKYNVSERQAAQDGIWMFLSIDIIPDVIYRRWKGFNENRFYKESRRIWLKTLWWYIHLSWQQDIESTYIILKENTSDDLVQLVERSGSKGYRVELYRQIMKNYSQVQDLEKGRKNQLFRKIMKLNTARARVVEPALTEGGEKQYVKELFNYFDRNKTREV